MVNNAQLDRRNVDLNFLPLEAGLRAAAASPDHAGQRTHRSFKQQRPGVLMLNIVAARVQRGPSWMQHDAKISTRIPHP